MNQKEKLNKVTATSARFSRIGAMSLGSKIAMGILALVVLMSVLSPFVSPLWPRPDLRQVECPLRRAPVRN